jgi:hypothetical protein
VDFQPVLTLSYSRLAKMTAFLKNAAVFETKRGHVFFKRGRLLGGEGTFVLFLLSICLISFYIYEES